jgi:hypothetical protein
MPESFVNVTEGSGKKLHSWQRTVGANTVEDEYVLQGENALATYCFPTLGAASSTATANSHLLQIMAGASLKVRIRRIEMHQSGLATTATFMQTTIVRLTTAGTGGTAVTPSPLDPADAASGATAMMLPTVKGTEGVGIAGASCYMMQTVTASAQMTNPIAVWDFDRPRSKPLIIPAGAANGIAVKNLTAVAAGTVHFTVWFDESTF